MAQENINLAVRNYIITATCVVMISLSLSDIYSNPDRASQQQKIVGYWRSTFIGLAVKAQKSCYR